MTPERLADLREQTSHGPYAGYIVAGLLALLDEGHEPKAKP